MFSSEYTRDTRQAIRLDIRQDCDTPDLELMTDSFRWRAAKEYNQLPVAIRKMKTVKTFKTSLWRWILTSIPIYP